MSVLLFVLLFFFFKQKTAYEMRISDWSSDVCSSDLARVEPTEGEPVTLPELLVRGSRSLNADIQRDIDDPQPYAIFDRTTIERSGAINLNDFLLKRVSSNTYTTSPSQSGEILGDRSGINLRGLGENQTLKIGRAHV